MWFQDQAGRYHDISSVATTALVRVTAILLMLVGRGQQISGPSSAFIGWEYIPAWNSCNLAILLLQQRQLTSHKTVNGIVRTVIQRVSQHQGHCSAVPILTELQLVSALITRQLILDSA